MENINIAIKHIEMEVEKLEAKVISLKKALRLLRGELDVENILVSTDSSIQDILPDSEEGLVKSSLEYADYPSSEPLHKRMEYLDVKFPHAFTMSSRKELLTKVEGKNCKSRYTNFSYDMKRLVNEGFYIGIKYNNSNRQQVYVRPEWFNDEIDNRHFIPGHEPKEEDIKHIPVAKRNLNTAEIIKSK